MSEQNTELMTRERAIEIIETLIQREPMHVLVGLIMTMLNQRNISVLMKMTTLEELMYPIGEDMFELMDWPDTLKDEGD